jgi:xylulokinase
VPPAGEYVADGAARQAAWLLSGAELPPVWPLEGSETYHAEPAPAVRARYAEVRGMFATRP